MAQVERWLEADAANRRLYEEYKTVWLLSRQTAMRESAEPADTGEAWQRFRSMAITRSGVGSCGRKRIRQGGRGWMRVAAMVAGTLILGAGGYLIWMNHRPDPKITPVTAMVAKNSAGGEIRESVGRRPPEDRYAAGWDSRYAKPGIVAGDRGGHGGRVGWGFGRKGVNGAAAGRGFLFGATRSRAGFCGAAWCGGDKGAGDFVRGQWQWN